MPFSNATGILQSDELALLTSVFDELKTLKEFDDNEALAGKLVLAFQAGARDRESLLKIGFLRTAKRAA